MHSRPQSPRIPLVNIKIEGSGRHRFLRNANWIVKGKKESNRKISRSSQNIRGEYGGMWLNYYNQAAF